MTTRQSTPERFQVPFCSLTPFMLITFGLAWGILGLFIFLPDQMTGNVWQIDWSASAFFLVRLRTCDRRRSWSSHSTVVVEAYSVFFSRLLLWRCPPVWYTFLIMGIPLIFYAGSTLKGNLFAEPFPFPSFQSICLALVLAAIKGPVEEFGWRGLVLPLLQRKLAPIWAGLVLGAIWGFWHLPAFLLSGTQQSEWSFAPFFAGCIALSVIVTALFNASRGSILLSALFHFMLMNPIFPDAEPYDTYLFVGTAVLVVWLNRKTMFTKDGAIVKVVPVKNTVNGQGAALDGDSVPRHPRQ